MFAVAFDSRSEAIKTESYLKGLKKRNAVLHWIEENKFRGVAQSGPGFVETDVS